MSTFHLYSLRNEERRERLEWLGDIVMEEAIVRVVARQALAALDWEEKQQQQQQQEERGLQEREGGTGGGGTRKEGDNGGEGMDGDTGIGAGNSSEGGFRVPATLRPLSWRLDFATRLAVSNANLRAVYEAQLVGLMGFVGLEEDQFLAGLSVAHGDAGGVPGGRRGRKRRRSSSFSAVSTGGLSHSPGKAASKRKRKNAGGKKERRRLCRSSSGCWSGAEDAGLVESFSPPLPLPLPSSKKAKRMDKRMPDMVEAVIGEAFEASLALPVDSRGAGGPEPTRPPSPGPQRFVGRHRAALVDRLLSAALNTEFLLSGLEESRAHGDGGSGGGGRLGDDVEGAEGPYGFDDELVCGSGFANSFGALDGSSSSSSDEEEEEADDEASAAGGAKGFCAAKAVAAAMAAAAAFAPTSATPCVAEGSSGGMDAGRDSIAAGREGVLRLYGAVLIKLRVSVFLFCSAAAAEAEVGQQQGEREVDGGGRGRGSSKEGPSELTLRRQGVMSGENLEAVAGHLQARRQDIPNVGGHGISDGQEASWAESPAPAAGGRRARDWMRVEVGRAALSCGGRGGGCVEGAARSADFSTRVAALLLSRSGERGDLGDTSGSSSSSGSGSGSAALSVDGGAAAEGPRDRGRSLVGEEPKTTAAKVAAGSAGGDVTAAAAALAVAEVQFGRDPWPEADLPRATAQAARMFLPRQGGGNRPGDSYAGSSAMAAGGGGGSGSGASSGPSAGIVGDGNGPSGSSTVSGDGESAYDLFRPCPTLPPSPPPSGREATAAVSGRKRKRRSGPGGGGGRGSGRLSCFPPPHYAGLLGQLPRDSRNLLARLGHQGYVKVLEEILDGFLRDSNATSDEAANDAAVTAAAAAATDDKSVALSALRTKEVVSSASFSAAAAAAAAGNDGTPGSDRDTTNLYAGRAEDDDDNEDVKVRGVAGLDPAAQAGSVAPHAASQASPLSSSPGSDHRNKDNSGSNTSRRQGGGGGGGDVGEDEDPWRALLTGAPHPRLSGLVEPTDLVRTGPECLVLPIPNPFYRRVLHALCRVHGLRSRGGEATRRREAEAAGPRRVGEGGDFSGGRLARVGAAAAAVDRHRTVEVTRGGGGGGGGWGGKRPGGTGGGDGARGVLALVPVETLLGEG